VTVSTWSKLVVPIALAAALPLGTRAASPARGLTHQRSIYADSTDGTLQRPEGLACDGRGNLVVADTGNARLLLFRWKDGLLDGGTVVKSPLLGYPYRLQIDSKGFVLVLDRRARRIVKVDEKGASAGYVEVKGASTPVTPAAFKLDGADNVHVLDLVARRVVVARPDGTLTRELPLPKEARGVTDLAVDAGGRVYVVDGVAAVVYVADGGDKAFRPLSQPLKQWMSFPTYLAPDNQGKLFVVDQNGAAIVRLGNDGTFQGRDLALGAIDGAVSYPGQICVTGDGDVFVADRGNDRVQIFSLPR
jgi:sugar lactone lactonase YvrE